MAKTMINQAVEGINEEVIEWRRYFHRHPELSYQEENTSQYIYNTLLSFENIEVSHPTKTSVMGRLIGNQTGKTVAIRADIDALPIEEENTFDFVSQNEGVMHACGHDGHTAMLLGTAKVLSGLKDEINGEVRFLFEHAEEYFPGGAKEMVEAGVLEDVDHVLAAHLMSTIDVGKIGVTYGPMTAAADAFWISVNGTGGHGAMPHDTVDSIVVASHVVSNLQQIVSRNVDPLDSVVLTVGNFVAEEAGNVIADRVKISGIVRSYDPKYRTSIPKRMEQIVKGSVRHMVRRIRLSTSMVFLPFTMMNT
ncbi:amidohydrolase [Geomicrobium halophilum]|uniref:Amidohydrolase n=1 Tax=Geomicrobium halophilum TaxID=549000 RepID=A0A841PXM3_9BACL|nr:amidohydrolase [Geomicrobium halophilum]